MKRRGRSGLAERGGRLHRTLGKGLPFHLLTWSGFAFSVLLMIILRWFSHEEPHEPSDDVVRVEYEPRPEPRQSTSGAQMLVGAWRNSRGQVISASPHGRHSFRRRTIAGWLLMGSVFYALIGAAWGRNLFPQSVAHVQSSVEAADNVDRNSEDGWLKAIRSSIGNDGTSRKASLPKESPGSPLAEPPGYPLNQDFEENQIFTLNRAQHMVRARDVFYEPAGCLQPTDERGWFSVSAGRLPLRTVRMLQHAADLYGAKLDLASLTLASNTIRSGINTLKIHVDQGMVTIPMTYPGSRHVLYNEVDPLVTALRVSGFAAWYQESADLNEAQIVAIAIGEPGLSTQEKALVYGSYGYFNGFIGLQDGKPLSDPHGGPIVCGWMIDRGYVDPIDTGGSASDLFPGVDWRARLHNVSEGFVTHSSEQTLDLARRLGYLGGTFEHPSNMCGPLTAAILLEADLIPSSVGPIRDPKSFWLSNPKLNGRPWMFFPVDEYEVFRSKLPLNYFQFEEWPLCAGDIVFTYAGNGEFSHVFVVTEVDELGRVYTVTNQVQADGGYLVERLLLYTAGDSVSGVFRNGWTYNAATGRTGLGGFEVLRRRGVCLQPGTLFNYLVRPGDTLPSLAERYSTTVEAILEENRSSLDRITLEVGQEIKIPVNTNLLERVSGG